MKKSYLGVLALLALIFTSNFVDAQGTVPEILYYKFDQTGTTVTNEASAPPAGTATGTLMGSMTQGGNGLCGSALVGTGGSSTADYVSTGWNTNLGNNPWTISFWIDDMPNTTTLYYQFGDQSAGGFRCFNNGVAGAGNFILRGPITDVLCTGCAPIGTPSMTTFVYDPVAGTITAYHDGVLNNVVSQGTLSISGADFKVGGYSGSTGMGSNQLMDEFRFYDRALTAQEVFDTYNACLPLVSVPNDIGVSSIDQPVNFCAGTQNVVATIKNYGTNQVDTCVVNWTIDGVAQTPYYFSGLLDTVFGAGSTTAQVTLGSATFNAGVLYNIEAWTDLPNLMPDTVTNNDTTSIDVQSSLNGTFTIGGVAPDYVDFASAAADLNAYGVCGPVIFDVRSGTYNEQVDLGEIAGTSATNTITFRSEDQHRDSVILTFSSTLSNENYTLRFSGADYVSWEQMTIEATGPTYGHVIEFTGNTEHNTIWDCLIDAGISTTTSTNRAAVFSSAGIDDYMSFIGNTISGGSYGTYLYGSGTTSLEKGLIFEDNECIDAYYMGTRFYYQDSVEIHNNTISCNSVYTGSKYAMYAGYIDGYSMITNNEMYVQGYGYGMFLTQCDASPVMKSRAHNNTVVIEDSTTTSTSYGMYFSSCNNWIPMNNSVNMISQGTSSRAAYVTGGAVELYNNILRNDGPGYALYMASGLTNSDHNDLYAPNGKVGYFGADQTTLGDWQGASFLDMNSVSGDPGFFSSTDLHTCNDSLLDMAGMVDTLITIDMDGQTRDTNGFDIGADEFLGLINLAFAEDTVEKCSQDAAILGNWQPVDDATYLWSTTETTPAINASTPGMYTVTVTTGCGSTSASIEVVDIPDAVAGFTTGTNFVTGIFTNTSSGTITSYLWDFGDGTTSTDSDPLHVYNATGTFTVTLTVTGPCGTDTFTQDITLEVAGLEENELGNALNVFPNPNNGEFEMTLTLENVSDVNASLVDARGQQIWNASIGAVNGTASETINVSNNAAGIYFLRVTADDRTSVRKIVVNK